MTLESFLNSNWQTQCQLRGKCVYLVELDALLRHSGTMVWKTEDPELSLYQVGGVLLHGGHIKCQPPEVRVEVCRRDDICKKRREWLNEFVCVYDRQKARGGYS